MRIIDVHIDGFGNLKNADYLFSNGMNIKEIGNVWDRSAVAEFIVAMFYGLEQLSRIRMLYAPRDGGGYGGFLTFSAGGVEYKITRSFSTVDDNDTYSFVDSNTGMPVPFQPSYFIGLTRDQFIKNGTVIEGSTYDDHSFHDENLIMGIVSNVNDKFESKKALETLDQAEKRLTRGGTRVVEEARYKEEQKQYDLQMDLKLCLQKSDEVKVLREQEAQAEKTVEEKKALMEEAEEKVNKSQNARMQKTQHALSLVLIIICIAGGFGLVLAGVVFRYELPGSVNGTYDTIYDGFLLLLFALVGFYFRRQWRRRQERKLDILRSAADGYRQEYEEALHITDQIQEQITETSKDADRVGSASDTLENFKKRVTNERYQLTVLRGARKYILAAQGEEGNEYLKIREIFEKESPALLVMDIFADHAAAKEVLDRIAEKCQVILLK